MTFQTRNEGGMKKWIFFQHRALHMNPESNRAYSKENKAMQIRLSANKQTKPKIEIKAKEKIQTAQIARGSLKVRS